jgi:histidinol-phosphate phosphatase family protein
MLCTKTKYLAIIDRDGTLTYDCGGLEFFETSHLRNDVVLYLSHFSTLFDFVVATNQSYVAKGKLSHDNLITYHQELSEAAESKGVNVTALAYCPHVGVGEKASCECRKPNPGMLQALIKLKGANLESSIFIGNRDTDFNAARNAGISYLDVDEMINLDLLRLWVKSR